MTEPTTAERDDFARMMRQWVTAVEEAEAERDEAVRLSLEGQQQLRYWWETKHSCPCGARAEALDTHPHVLACPTGSALASLDATGA